MEVVNHKIKPDSMSSEQMRAEIKEWVDQIDDERFLRSILAMLQTYVEETEDPIIGYEADGTPVRASVAKAQFAEDLSKPEEFMSVEDFESELDQAEAA